MSIFSAINKPIDTSRTRQLLSRWKALIQPADSLTNERDKERARFLASLALGTVLFHLLIIGIILFTGELTPDLMLITLSLGAVLGIYGLSRTPYYQYGVGASVLLATTWAFIRMMSQEEPQFMLITLLPVFLTSLFYTAPYVLVGGGLVVISTMLFLDIDINLLNDELHILITGAITLMLTVITALRQYNRTLRDERNYRLAQSELRFRTIFEASLSAFFLLESVRDAAGEIEDFVFVDVNQKGLELVNMTRDQLVGQRLLAVSPSNRKDGFFEKYTQVVQTGEGHEEEFMVEPGDLTAGWYSHQVVKISDGIAISTVDITSRKEKEYAANQIQLEKQQMEILRNFVGEFSHDLLTPITILRTSLYLLSKDVDAEMRAVRIARLNTQLTNLERMIREMLTLSRLDSPITEAFTFEPYYLNEMLDTLVIDYQQIATNRQQAIRFQPKADLPLVPLDIHTMPRALGNLIDNALKYTPEGGTVYISTDQAETSAVITIRDTGTGIDAAHLPHIFDRFYREDRNRHSVSGTGIGLAIVYKIIQGHKGTIEVSSTVGQGTTFTVKLPLDASNA